MQLRKGHILACAATILLGWCGTVIAAGAPVAAVSRHPGGVLIPLEETPVAVVRERLVLDLRERTGHVVSTYVLQNTSDSAVRVSAAFAVPDYGLAEGDTPLTVAVDGSPLNAVPLERDIDISSDEVALPAYWVDPFTSQRYRPPQTGASDPAFSTFTLAFAPHQQHILTVHYAQDAAEDYTRFVTPSRRWDYLLASGDRWAGFGELQVQVLTPSGYPVQSVPALTQTGTGEYGATFSTLPDQNLTIFVAPGKSPAGRLASLWGHLSSWWRQRTLRAWLELVPMLVISLITGALQLSSEPVVRSMAVVGRWVALAAALAVTPRAIFQGEPIGFLSTWFLFVPAMVLWSTLVGGFPRLLADEAGLHRLW